MEIRQLTKNDAEGYQEIRLEALQNNPEAFASSFEEECEHPIDKYIMKFQSDNSFTFGAFEKDKLVGVITLVKETLNKLSHRANIVAMYVSPCNRGLGIGKDLIKKAINQAKELEGLEQLYITVVTTNSTAKRLYTSLGFEKFGTEKRALKVEGDYFDEDLMVLFF